MKLSKKFYISIGIIILLALSLFLFFNKSHQVKNENFYTATGVNVSSTIQKGENFEERLNVLQTLCSEQPATFKKSRVAEFDTVMEVYECNIPTNSKNYKEVQTICSKGTNIIEEKIQESSYVCKIGVAIFE